MSEDRLQSIAYVKSAFLAPSDSLLADQLVALRRYSPLLLALQAPDPLGLPAEAVRSLGSQAVPMRALSGLAHRLGGRYPFFEGLVRREGCRLIHALSGWEGPYGARLRARSRLPLVTTFQGADVAMPVRRNPRFFERLFAEGDLFLASAEAIRKELLALGCPKERLLVHHPGLDLARITFAERKLSSGGAVNVLLVGQMVERKGIPYALQAFSIVHRYRRNTTLTLIGDGPLRPMIEAQIKELRLGDVRLLGAQPREAVLAEMQRAHIFILPSAHAADGDTEGIPGALIEAQASGLPALTTWHSGIPELVVDGKSGYVVSERDTQSLIERLRHLVDHPELWPSMGRAGRAIVEAGFDLRRQTDELEALYDGLLGAG